ncbi:hypothetical protein SME13J_02760 [Serratia marcescens]|nr:hypothetical protein SME13J_02760 [Serratia marcescens]
MIGLKNGNTGEITYQTLRDKRQRLQDESDKRIQFVRAGISSLVAAYTASLCLENASWTDIDGQERGYVQWGTRDNDGFTPQSLDSITTHQANIAVATVVDDGPRGGEAALCNITVTSDRHAQTLSIAVHGRGGKTFSIMDGDFAAVCGCMKDVTYAAISAFDDFA